MMLLDTNALVWFETDDPRMGKIASRLISESIGEGRAIICPISFWEIELGIQRGRISLASSISSWRQRLLSSGYDERAIDGRDTISMATLQDFHADPADRLIVSVAMNANLTLVTSDQKILSWRGPLKRIDLTK